VLSCQNYDDEFDALNSKIASLESQITSLAELRTAVTGVQSSISALQSAVAAAQAAAEAAGDAAEAAGDANAEAAAANAESIAALATSVAAIAADLVDLQTAIDGASTEADLDALKSELNTTLAALQALIESNASSIASLVTSDVDLKEALEELGVDVNSVLASNATFEGELKITNAAELAFAKSLGAKVATIKGNVIISVDETDHTGGGDGTGLTAADVSSVTSLITYVVGDVKVSTDASLDFSSMTSISGDYMVIGHDISDDALIAVGGDVHFDHDGAYSSKIQSAGNIFLISKASVAGSTTVTARTGTTSIDFSLTKASSLQTVSPAVAALHTSGSSITYGSSANTNSIVVEGTSGTSGTNATTSIKIGQIPVVSISGGDKLTSIDHLYAGDKFGTKTTGVDPLPSLSITAPKLVKATISAGKISGAVTIDVVAAAATTATGTIDFPNLVESGAMTSDASSNGLTMLKTVSGLTLSEQTTVSLPALTTVTGAALTLDEATSFSAPLLSVVGTATVGKAITANKVTGSVALPALTKAGALTFGAATSFVGAKAVINSIDLASSATSIDVASVPDPDLVSSIAELATLKTINLHAQADPGNAINLALAAEATSVTILGKTNATDVDINGFGSVLPKLATLTLGGKLGTVTVDQTSALTKIVTAGTISAITLDDNDGLTTLTLGHTEDATNGAAITITNNDVLTTFTTSADRVRTFVVTGNPKLSSFNASSIKTLPTNFATGTFTFTVTGNFTQASGSTDVLTRWSGMTGTFAKETNTTARIYGQSSLATLKPYVQALYDKAWATTPAMTDTNVSINFNYKVSDPSTSAAATATVLLSNTASFTTPANAEGTTFAQGTTTDADLKAQWLEILKLQ
jgi:predicted  nucleic acid-binding Zn-ribbon protein